MTQELSIYNTQSFDTSNSKLNLTSEDEPVKNTESDVESENERSAILKEVSKDVDVIEKDHPIKKISSQISPFLDVVASPAFPILFSSYSIGPLSDQSPFNNIVCFSPFKSNKLLPVIEKVHRYYKENERSLLICDDFSSLASVDSFGNHPACVVNIKGEIWY